jgi:hypothetical protein
VFVLLLEVIVVVSSVCLLIVLEDVDDIIVFNIDVVLGVVSWIVKFELAVMSVSLFM